MSRVEEIQAAFEKADLANLVRTGAADYERANESMVSDIIDWAEHEWDGMMSLLRAIKNDSEDINTTIAIFYIECKSTWIALNSKMNYQMFRGIEPEADLVIRGFAMSQLIAISESLIPQEDIDSITEFLTQPIKHAA
ncbi:MAG: hypothetical protein AAGD00_10135 [Planctomycetota bacterium]